MLFFEGDACLVKSSPAFKKYHIFKFEFRAIKPKQKQASRASQPSSTVI